MAKVIHLPRPQDMRPISSSLGFYVRVGRNDHLEMLDLLASGEKGIFGFVIEAPYVNRHRDLLTEARKLEMDLILDPKTQELGLPGSFRENLAALPWGQDKHQGIADFTGENGRTRAHQIVEFAREHGFTHLLGPTHLLSGVNDPWLRRDIQMMSWTKEIIERSGGKLELIYSLAFPIGILRRSAERRALIAAIEDAPCDSIWIKIENFGDTSTGEKTAAYIEACRDFHERGIPIIADHVGGLPGLGALAFGAVSGLAHGVTVHQNFVASSWRRPPTLGGGGGVRRIYMPQLDMLLKPKYASELLGASSRVKALCGCRDSHCCPHGVRDMISRPAQHALYQRAREIEVINSAPSSVRISQYLEDRVRKVSDNVASVASLQGIDDALREKLVKKQGYLSRFRHAMAHAAASAASASTAVMPSRHYSQSTGRK